MCSLTVRVCRSVDPDNGDSGGRDHGSGWWYEGGGLYRHVNLIRTAKVHVDQDGLFAYSNLTWAGAQPSGILHAKMDVVNNGPTHASVCVSYTLTAPNGESSGSSGSSDVLSIAPGAVGTSEADITVTNPALWSASNPNLYNISATIQEGDCTGQLLDAVDAPHGFRSLRYDANEGFFLNKVFNISHLGGDSSSDYGRLDCRNILKCADFGEIPTDSQGAKWIFFWLT